VGIGGKPDDETKNCEDLAVGCASGIPLVSGVGLYFGGERMKTNSFAIFLCVFLFLTATGWADDIKEADYPVHYEVLSASKTDKVVIQKVCSMSLRDQANPNTIITVSRKRIGSCPVFPGGKVYNGRQNAEKNTVELVIPVGDTKARVESWHIDATLKNPQ
jgi:UDP-N-acetylmuramyl pentapeptide phosphotransferase/UDP-N-acetylglucosamine-1-phosphate transferase